MSKKCVICGIELDENVAVCPKCGTHDPTEPGDSPFITIEPAAPVVIDAPATVAVSVKPVAPAKKKAKPLPFILGGAAVVIVAVAVLVITLFGGAPEPAPSPEPTLIDNCLALMNGNLDVLEQMAPDEYWEFVARVPWNKTKDEYLAMEKESYTKHFNNRDEQYSSFKVTGEIISEADMNEKTLQKTAETLFFYYGISESSVTAGKELTVQWAITTSGNSWKTLPEVLSAVEIDGVWYLVYHRDDGDYLELDFYRFSKQVKSSCVQ
ncbi:MAG: zinc ribbon domain-containing protein [Oscillospiraceae bacterium]|nr:zinc ribbon domain-containing protein [Oscillospiraceae bacterium]